MSGRGDGVWISGQHEEGLALVRRAAQLAPADPLPRVSIARALFGAWDYDAGIGECKEAIAQGLDHPELHQLWAFALTSMGRPAEGVEVLEQAERLHPGHPPRLAYLATPLNSHASAPPPQGTASHPRYDR